VDTESGSWYRCAVSFCKRPACPRQTFAEAIPEIAERYARRTRRLTVLLSRLGLALGGEAGARLTTPLGMTCSPDTLLRVLHRLPDEPVEMPRVVGIDDWAWRKGHHYGTLICDLERHKVIDLLPDRTVTSVANWLKHSPSVEIISRDRGDIYAQGARLGAPQAIQVADKWHLLKNLGEALERLLTRHLTAHRKQQRALQEIGKPRVLEERSPRLSQHQERIVQSHRQERRSRYDQVIALREQGMSQQTVASLLGVGHSTVQRWLATGTFPERKPREQASQLDPYLSFIRARWVQGIHNVARIHRELATKGYKGSYSSVSGLLNGMRQGNEFKRTQFSPAERHPSVSSRYAVWLFLSQPEKLREEERETLETLRHLHQEVALAYDLVQQFAQIVRTRTGAHLESWMEAVSSSSLTDLHPFVAGVSQDKAAVQAGLTLPWSQGQTEGQITRLKLIKRQGYGRAGFDLLRRRVLHAA